jgi:transposase-like protein
MTADELFALPNEEINKRLDAMITDDRCALCSSGPLVVVPPRAPGCSRQWRCEKCDFSTGN